MHNLIPVSDFYYLSDLNFHHSKILPGRFVHFIDERDMIPIMHTDRLLRF